MRSYRELWLWLGAAFLALFAAFIAIGLAYFTKEQHFSFFTCWETWTSVAAFILGFACFALAITGTPFPPWIKMKFPNISVEIHGAANMVTQYAVPTGPGSNVMKRNVSLRVWRVRITNMETEQNASLTFTLFVKLVPGSLERVGESVWGPPDWPLDPALGLSKIDMPIILAPGTTVGGESCIRRRRVRRRRRCTAIAQALFDNGSHLGSTERNSDGSRPGELRPEHDGHSESSWD